MPEAENDQPYTGPTRVLPVQEPIKAAARRPLSPSQPRPKPPLTPAHRRHIWSWLRWAGIGLLLLILVACAGLVVLQQTVAGRIVVPDERTNRPVRGLLVSPINILLLGVDLRASHPEEGVRSDTLQLLHLDPAGGWASLLAIPRDSIASIPGEGDTKINRGFAHGYEQAGSAGLPAVGAGMATAADTVESFLRLPALGQRINYVATINFDGFAAIVDALGGIDIDVPQRIVDDAYPTPDFGTMRLVIEAGHQHMNGARALQYVRTRHADSDFGRSERQQQVLQAMSTALRNQPLPLRPFVALRVLEAASGAVETTLPVGRPDALLLGLNMARFNPAQLQQYRLTPDVVNMQEDGSDLHWDATGVQQLAAKLFSPPGEAQERARLQVLNGTGVAGLAARITTTLTDAQFNVDVPGDTPPTPKSRIVVYNPKPYTIKRLQALLLGMPVVQAATTTSQGDEDATVVLGDDFAQFITP
ncbi:MAG: LCP family protein [Herpetosiphonaceae bacterium]|nr:LCP family protein [Herpetosiphonaceae bacterium]